MYNKSAATPNDGLSNSTIFEIENELRKIRQKVNDIENNDIAPWIRYRKYAEMKIEYTPAVKSSTILLRHCTESSIKQNCNHLLDFYIKENKLTLEIAKYQIEKLLKHYDSCEENNFELKEKMFATIWKDNVECVYDDEYAKIPNKQCGYYCIYFSEAHTLEDVEWFLEHDLKKVLPSNAKIRTKRRMNTKALEKNSFIGFLTWLGLKPKDIERLCDKYLGLGVVSNTDINRTRNDFSKNDWFREAEKEYKELLNDSDISSIYDDFVQATISAINSETYEIDDSKLPLIPKFFDLNFSEQKGKKRFHLSKFAK